jgi:acetoin utilization deacetylase AcuC-like enzyme
VDQQKKPIAVVVALGLDTAKGDPVSTFLLETGTFEHLGKMLAQLKLPIVFVLEGGYAIYLVGKLITKTLTAFCAN